MSNTPSHPVDLLPPATSPCRPAVGENHVRRLLNTLQPFPPGTLIAASGDGLPLLPANEAMAHFLRLRQRLKELEHRLGTPFETCADLDEARNITHALWNYVQIRWMWSYLGSGRLPEGLLGQDRPRGDAA